MRLSSMDSTGVAGAAAGAGARSTDPRAEAAGAAAAAAAAAVCGRPAVLRLTFRSNVPTCQP